MNTSDAKITHSEAPGHIVYVTRSPATWHTIDSSTDRTTHGSQTYTVRHFAPGKTYKDSTVVGEHATHKAAMEQAISHINQFRK